MSYSNALQLLRLADLAASRHLGITLEEVCDEFGCSLRTSQRMMRALEEAFPLSVAILTDEERRRRWRLKETSLSRLRLQGADELEALETAIESARSTDDVRHAAALSGLRDRLLAALPPTEARAAETDSEALLEAYGMAARPGPAVKTDRSIAEAIAEALRGPFRMSFDYNEERRLVEPYGVLIGARRYLVARQPSKGSGFRHFRLDLIYDASITDEWFSKDPDFNIRSYSERSFGSYQNDREYGEVLWLFKPEAADRASEWQFHPSQSMTLRSDGHLEVRFSASGWLEMAWHLHCWGDLVEVLAPEGLRDLIALGPREYAVLP
ncbi:helix-turn-helix transcriptional regulator [Nioella sp.]|uniref:helix-turn-helix transcriptional regulator n=1 Tax=Nioella sp. TaxID=1912091 RepID=UPI003A83647D